MDENGSVLSGLCDEGAAALEVAQNVFKWMVIDLQVVVGKVLPNAHVLDRHALTKRHRVLGKESPNLGEPSTCNARTIEYMRYASFLECVPLRGSPVIAQEQVGDDLVGLEKVLGQVRRWFIQAAEHERPVPSDAITDVFSGQGAAPGQMWRTKPHRVSSST